VSMQQATSASFGALQTDIMVCTPNELRSFGASCLYRPDVIT
jgi:hypothetical protein